MYNTKMQYFNKSTSNFKYLPLIHIAIIAISNVLVQYPFKVFGFHTTCAIFTFPMIFLITDVTVRILGSAEARRVVLKSMLPGLIISYLLATLFSKSSDIINILAIRVAIGSFTGYLLGQLLDIMVFQRFRVNAKWWLAPTASSLVGNIVDTYSFMFVAFYYCSDPVLSAHWPEIAFIDFVFKFLVSIFCFIPMYGITINYFTKKFKFATTV